MNPWSARRRAVIFVIGLIIVVLAVGTPVYYYYFHTVPNCSDGKQDGDETGIDCGGGCQLICKPEILPIITVGDARLLKIATSTYEAVIQVQNPNVKGRVVRAPYTFTIYSGTSNKPVTTISGNTYIARNSTFALFAGPVTITGASPLRANFAWGNLVWETTSDTAPLLSVENMNLVTASTSLPRLEATLVNHTMAEVDNVEVVALLSDNAGNIVAAGKTFVDAVSPSGSTPVAFSWPAVFAADPVTINIIPHVLPDKSYIK